MAGPAVATVTHPFGGSLAMFITSRCNQAGPLGKYIPTRSFAAFLFARLQGRTVRLRW